MSSKDQTRSKPKASSKQNAPNPATGNLTTARPQSHLALIQRARLDPESLTPRDVAQLQPLINNQAVGGLLAKAEQPQALKKNQTTLQLLRATRSPTLLYMSENRKFAMFGGTKSKEIYVKNSFFAEVNRQLAEAGGQGGSYLKLVGTGGGADALPDDMTSATIHLRTDRGATSDQYHRKVINENKNPAKEFLAHSDCAMFAQLVLGSDAGRTESRRPTTRSPEGEREVLSEPPAPNQVDLPGPAMGGAQSIANRLLYRLFETVFPRFAEALGKQPSPEKYTDMIERINTASRAAPPANYNGFLDIYNQIQDDSELKPIFNSMFGLNESITPRIGDALVFLADPREYAKNKEENAKALKEYKDTHGGSEEGFVEKEAWNFHWAGVLLVDGSDYITVENLSLENEDLRNTAWYFQIHGPGRDSFHTKMEDDPHATDHGVTAVIANVSPPKRQVRNPFLK